MKTTLFHRSEYRTPMSFLPVIIDGPGIYRCRDGKLAHVHTVKEGAAQRTNVTAFDAKGSRKGMYQGKECFMGYFIWHISGRYLALGESPYDIVAKVAEENSNV